MTYVKTLENSDSQQGYAKFLKGKEQGVALLGYKYFSYITDYDEEKKTSCVFSFQALL